MNKYRTEISILEDASFNEIIGTLQTENYFACVDVPTASTRPRYTVVGLEPSHTFSLAGAFVEVDGHVTIDTPAVALAKFFARARELPHDPYLPIGPCALGFIGFEGARALSGHSPAKGFSRLPQAYFGIYENVVVFDHVENTARVVGDLSLRIPQSGMKQSRTNEIASSPSTQVLSAQLLAMTTIAPPAPDSRLVPDDANFANLTNTAHEWLVSESIDRVHLVRHVERPVADSTPADEFMKHRSNSTCAALFTVRNISSVLCRGGSSELAPLPFSAGYPTAKAVSFIDEYETENRGAYGGSVGIVGPKSHLFSSITRATTFSDGTVRSTSGIDMTREMSAREVTDRLTSIGHGYEARNV